MPIFIAANDDLRKITKKQIEEIKTIKKPSPTMLSLAKAICIIMKVEPVLVGDKESNFVMTQSYWNAFLGPKLLGNLMIHQKFTQMDP